MRHMGNFRYAPTIYKGLTGAQIAESSLNPLDGDIWIDSIGDIRVLSSGLWRNITYLARGTYGVVASDQRPPYAYRKYLWRDDCGIYRQWNSLTDAWEMVQLGSEVVQIEVQPAETIRTRNKINPDHYGDF